MAISYIGNAYNTSNAAGSTFTLNKPDGVQAGDLLIALATVYNGYGAAEVTFTAPSGWIRVDQDAGTSYYGMSMAVFKRVATGSDPTSWTGNYSRTLTSLPEAAVVVAYRGASDVGNHSINAQNTSGNSWAAPSASNTEATSWRTTIGACSGATLGSTFNCTESTLRRKAETINGTSDSIQSGIWDSGAPIAVGSSNKSFSRGSNWDAIVAATLIILAANVDPSSGDFTCQLPKLSSSLDANAHADGPIDADLPKLAAAFEGEGVPQPSDGSFACTTPSLSSAVTGGSAIVGQLGATLGVVAAFVGETVPFGIRVIPVDAEDRTIVVPSRGVEA